MSFDMTGFKEFSFADGSPYVTITANGMNFNKAVVNKLNSCEYARLLINAQTKQIILVEAQKEDSNAIDFITISVDPTTRVCVGTAKSCLTQYPG